MRLANPVRLAILAILFFSSAASQIVAGQTPEAKTSQPLSEPATAKERLSDKGSDEQRVNDCKVPVSRRSRERPTDCAWDLRT